MGYAIGYYKRKVKKMLVQRKMSAMKNKTNVMRILEQNKILYQPLEYELGENAFSGEKVAEILGIQKGQMFKTLTGKGSKKGVVVFVVPVDHELNLKSAATAFGDKKVELLSIKDLLAVTGYVRGEVSPIGMKKKYPVLIDESALSLDYMIISGGKKGCSLLVEPKELAEFLHAKFVSLT